MSKGNCARCMTPTKATVLCAFGYENVRYEIKLCDRHAEMLDREMLGWLRIASEVEPPKLTPAKAPSRLDHGPKISTLIPRTAPREVVLDEPVQLAKAAISDVALSYQFTAHAAERVLERRIAPADIYRLIDDPSKMRSPSENGCHVYRKGDLKIVVNEKDRTIITASRRDALKELIA